jgi:hypothetical protein
MSHFMRMQKGEVTVRKAGYFWSGDDGGKDAGAGNSQPQAQPSVPSHLHSIADRHENEAGAHDHIASRLDDLGLSTRSADHKKIALEHKVAAGHYRAAAAASEDTSDSDGLAKHLKNARESASRADELTKCMA